MSSACLNYGNLTVKGEGNFTRTVLPPVGSFLRRFCMSRMVVSHSIFTKGYKSLV